MINLKKVQFSKWNDSVWLSVERELSMFQKKVTDVMIAMGDAGKTKLQDFMVQPVQQKQVVLGDEFYLDMIRPICVKKGYLPKKLPTIEDFKKQELDLQQQQSIMKNKQRKFQQQQKESIKGKKGGKNNQGKGKQQKMKIQIAKDNFNKDIELVLKSFSLERFQFQFGFKQEKIELKLITFFYIAYYIRKNKVQQKIQQSLIFELINILIKIVRIFKGLKGPSYMNRQQEMEISPTIILDLKMCIDGMKQYYKYQNKTIILKYPKLIYYTSYDKFFPTLDIKPYKSQIDFIQEVKTAFNERGDITNPTLLLYKPMIGSGKTTASIALSQLIRDYKLMDQKNSMLQLVYCCVVNSVRIQVGRYAYNKQQKFALAAMEQSIKDNQWHYPKVIKSWSCRTQKFVDLIISDAYCAYQMLDKHNLNSHEKQIMDFQRLNRKNEVIVGQLQRQNIILFIDEPTAFCKDPNSPATRKIFDILANYPPKLTILSSATMPSQKQLANTIQLIKRKNNKLRVVTVESKQFQIGCQYCSFKGDIIFPHTGVKNKKELEEIYQLIQKNPFLLRLYTGPSLFFLLRRCQKVGLTKLPQLNSLQQVKQDDIISATFKILRILKVQSDDLIEQVCKRGGEQANIDFKQQNIQQSQDQQERQQKQKRKDYVNFKKMVRGDAYKFLGGCLIGTSQPLKFAHAMFEKWVKDIKPIRRLLQKYEKDVKDLNREIELIEADQQMREEKKTQKISKLQSQKQPVFDFPQSKKINTSEHYHKYCKNKQTIHNSMLIKPIPAASLSEELYTQVDDFILKLLFCGVGIYTQQRISSKYLDKVEQLASQNYLAYIITDQSLCYGTNFPISNVILRDDLAQRLNMNEMFQLIGRAGRVGQSWTARAFLQDHGVNQLQKYIHQQQKAVNQQGLIFQQIAKEHLDYPLLKLRSLRSEIRYKNHSQNTNSIEILIKKKIIQQSDLIQSILVLPYIQTGVDLTIYSKKCYNNINYFQFPSSDLLYDDIPKTKNSKGQQIIDISAYYINDVQFIKNTINNAANRIITSISKITLSKQQNYFAPKVYVDYFNKQTKTFCILLKQTQQVPCSDYKYQQMKNNKFQKDDVFEQKIMRVVQQAKKLTNRIRSNVSALTQNQFESFSKLHSELINQQKYPLYVSIFNHEKPQANIQYQKIIANYFDKEAIQYKDLSICALAVNRFDDIINLYDKNYHVDKIIRGIWQRILKMIYS